MRGHPFEARIASVFFIGLFLVILWQVGGRTPFLNGPVWTEELARWLWVWMALTGIGAVERQNAHLRMGFLVERLPPVLRRGIDTAADILYLGLCLHLVWIAGATIRRTWRNEAVTLPATDAVLYGSALVALILVAHRVIRRLGTRLAPPHRAGNRQ